ncbi:MAG: UPF0182 family protein [Coriobacteriia bacterium]|nr:UPF0182 family protein [Coriobacteriia bacterium]
MARSTAQRVTQRVTIWVAKIVEVLKSLRSLERKVLRIIIIVAVIVVAAFALYGFLQLYLNYLWYRSLGQQEVFIGRVIAQALTMLACSAIAAIMLCGPLQFAGRVARVNKRLLRLATWVALVLAVISGVGMSSSWMAFRLAVSGASFGVTDPLFKIDAGFFVFVIPALNVLYDWLIGLLSTAAILVLVALLIPQRADIKTVWDKLRWNLKIAVSVLAALYVLIGGAAHYLLLLFRLDSSNAGIVAGATYADVHVRLPVFIIVIIASIVLTIILLATARSHKLKLPVYSMLIWVILLFVGTQVAPRIVQYYVVGPNEPTLERPYIVRNIKMTRKAFQLDSVETTNYPALTSIPQAKSAQAKEQLRDVAFWGDSTSNAAATQAFNQLQQIRPYYSLSSLMTDRYVVAPGGKQQQMLISSRLINTSGLPSKANNWVNSHLVYTHGYGSIVSSVSETSQGMLQFVMGGVPPTVSQDTTSTASTGLAHLAKAQQKLYFGPGLTSYIITNTKLDEFNYPKTGSASATNRAKDIVGVKFGGTLRRIAWAIKYGSTKFLFSSYLKPDSVVVDNRDIVSRANAIAPWFSYSKDPSSTIVNGRTYWVLDGYTTSSTFPYSQKLASGSDSSSTDKGKNYVRASIKVVVDAATGETKFYAVGDDPIRDAWAKIFPSVITPQSEIPSSLAAHFLYPRRAFNAQAVTYLKYHITDPMTFYNQEDLWQVSKGADGGNSACSYLMLIDAGDSKQLRVHLMQTFSPVNTPNLISLMTAGCDPNNYGELTIYQLPKEHVTLSAMQVNALINQDPTIAPQLALWKQSSSNVTMGSMEILPVTDSIIYVQPVFLQAQKNAVPQLVRVIVANGNKTAMGLTLDDALSALGQK